MKVQELFPGLVLPEFFAVNRVRARHLIEVRKA